MIINMTGGGGGGGLNFKVVQYTATPTGTAKENTIGVVTDTAISDWVMQSEEPTGSEGLVWIEVAAESDVAFYADKKQLVKLYPKAVKQYIGSSWASLNAFVYQDGEWVAFSSSQFIIYQSGEGMFPNFSSGGSGGSRKVEENSNGIHLQASVVSQKGGSSYCYAYTTDKIDVSGFDNLYFTLVSYRNVWKNGSTVIAVSSSLPSGTTFSGDAYKKFDASEYSNEISSIDISNLTGSYYIVVYAAIGGYNDGNSYADAVYDDIYLG